MSTNNKKDITKIKKSKKEEFKKVFDLKNKSILYGAILGFYIMIIILLGLASTILIPVISNESLGIEVVTSWAIPLGGVLFIMSNIIAEVFGKKKAIFALGFGYFVSLIMGIYLMVGWGILKDTEMNNYYNLETGEHFFPFDAIGPNWRFQLAGLVAFTTSTLVNVVMIWSMKRKYGNRKLWLRLLLSSLIGQGIDNIVFGTLAFAPLGITAIEFNWQTIFSIAAFEYLFEIVTELVLSYPTKLLIKKIQKVGLYEDLDGSVMSMNQINQRTMKGNV